MAGIPRHIDLRAAADALTRDGDPSMADIARSLGVAKPTLYRHARSRDELVAACVEAETERLLEHVHAAFARAIDAPRSERVAAGVSAVLRFGADSPGGFRLLFATRHPHARAAVRRVEDRLRDLLRRESRDVVDAELLAAALLGAAVAAARRAAEDGRSESATELARRLATHVG